MTATDIQIKNDQLTTTGYINMVGAGFTPGALKKKNQIDPIQGQRAGSSTSFVISKGDILGIENPVHIIRGFIDTNDYANTAALWAVSGLSEINLGYLYELWRNMTGVTYVKIPFGITEMNWKTYDNSSTEIPVVVDSVSFSLPDDAERRHLIVYNITLREIRV